VRVYNVVSGASKQGDCGGVRVLAECSFPGCVDGFEISERRNLKTGKDYEASSKRAE
jgi:hypothetical protein